jgi:DNA-binding beta-propeller fold protein YncE
MDPVRRRRFVQAAGGGLAFALAGCVGGGDDGEGGEEDEDHDHDHDHDDEDDGDALGSAGLVYAFAPETIALVDPEAGEVVEELPVEGAEWGDPRITHDHSRIFVNEGSAAQVVVIDTERREIAGEVDVGPDPVHVYEPVEGEIWSHSDAEGAFYVIDAESLEVIDVVEAGLEGEGHGKLLHHPDLDPKAYAMNVNDAAGLVIDLEERERVAEFELEGPGGTHYKAYAPETGLAYFQRAGPPGGTAVIDAEADEVVDALDVSGGMYLSPDERRLCVLDDEAVHVLDATSEESELLGTIEVAGAPGALRYHESDGTLYGFTANAESPDVSVLDLESFEEVDRIETGEVEGRYRAGVAGGGYFVTTADADGTVAIVDVESRELVAEVEVAEGVDTVQYVGEEGEETSGTGYTSR